MKKSFLKISVLIIFYLKLYLLDSKEINFLKNIIVLIRFTFEFYKCKFILIY